MLQIQVAWDHLLNIKVKDYKTRQVSCLTKFNITMLHQWPHNQFQHKKVNEFNKKLYINLLSYKI